MLELFIVIIVFSSPVLIFATIKRYFAYKTSIITAQAKLKWENSNNKIIELEKQTATLNERLAVLEQIVTSRHFELSSKIAQL